MTDEHAIAQISTITNELGFGIDVDTIAIPRARLAQGLTSEVLEGIAQAGQWILPGGKIVPEISGTIVGTRKTRILWDRTEQKATIACRSFDGVTGQGNPGGLCAECVLSQWQDDTPPRCTLSYEYLVNTTDGTPVVISISTRSGAQTIGQLNLALRMRGQIDATFRSTLVVKGSRKYYVPTVNFRWE